MFAPHEAPVAPAGDDIDTVGTCDCRLERRRRHGIGVIGSSGRYCSQANQ
jgi:hypothetical protein